MKNRKTILVLEVLAFLLVVGIFLWQLDTMPYLRGQLQAGLHRSLDEVLEETAGAMDAQLVTDLQAVNRGLAAALTPDLPEQGNPNQLLPAFFLNSSAHPQSDAWFVVLPRPDNAFQVFEYKRPDRYRRGQTRTGTWRTDTELTRFVRDQLQQEADDYGGFQGMVQTRWANVIDSTIAYRRAWTFGNDLILGSPAFSSDSTFLGMVFNRVNAWYMENVWLRHFFQDQYWTRDDPKAGLERRHLKFGVFSSREDRLLYHSVAFGDPTFEHQLSLSSLDSWLADWRLGLGFRNAQVAEVADAIFQRNLYLIIGLFVLLLVLLVLIFLSALRMIRLSRLKTEFVANVTHELKTPLASIRLVTDTLRLGRVHNLEQARPMVDSLSREVDRLQTLMENLLDFSRLEGGKQPFHFQTRTVGEWTDHILAFFRDRTGPELSTEQHTFSTRSLALDPVAMEQVFTILLDNARKYGPEDLQIHLRIEETKKKYTVSLRDNGRGIRREDQAAIFDKFVRVGNTDVHDVKGHGIGLSIARSILRAHGGHIGVRSRWGEGATFYLELPLRKVTPTKPIQS